MNANKEQLIDSVEGVVSSGLKNLLVSSLRYYRYCTCHYCEVAMMKSSLVCLVSRNRLRLHLVRKRHGPDHI